MLQSGDLVRFTPDALTYGLDAEGLIGILGVITRCVYDAELDGQYAMVLWPGRQDHENLHRRSHSRATSSPSGRITKPTTAKETT